MKGAAVFGVLKKMKVLLLKDVPSQGKKGDIINVSDGYAHNYLIPRGLAKEATSQILNEIKSKDEAAAYKKEMEKKAALEMAEKLKDVIIKFKSTGGADGRLYGAVTSKDIVEKLKADHGFEIDKKKIVVSETIKKAGEYNIKIKLYPEIIQDIKLIVEI